MNRNYLLSLAFLGLGFWACDDDDDSEPPEEQDTEVNEKDTEVNDQDTEVIKQDAEVIEQDAAVPPCDEKSNFGLRAWPQDLTGDVVAYTPKTFWNGNEFVAQWIQPEGDKLDVWFGRFDRDGNPLGDPLLVGPASTPTHEILYTGTQYLSIWASDSSASNGFNGLQMQTIDASGQRNGVPQNIPLTYDVTGLAAAHAVNGAGMMVYVRGVNGTGGVFARRIQEDGTVANAIQLSENAAMSPAVTYGSGFWGTAWLDRTTESPSTLKFQLLNENGQLINTEKSVTANASGNVYLAFGDGVFGIGLSRSSSGSLLPFLAILNASGETQVITPLASTTGYIRVTDVSWLQPSFFGVAWQENADETTVGLSRVSSSGQVYDPFRFETNGSSLQAMDVTGNATRTFATYASDPEPPLQGGASDACRIKLAVMGTCAQ